MFSERFIIFRTEKPYTGTVLTGVQQRVEAAVKTAEADIKAADPGPSLTAPMSAEERTENRYQTIELLLRKGGLKPGKIYADNKFQQEIATLVGEKDNSNNWKERAVALVGKIKENFVLDPQLVEIKGEVANLEKMAVGLREGSFVDSLVGSSQLNFVSEGLKILEKLNGVNETTLNNEFSRNERSKMMTNVNGMMHSLQLASIWEEAGKNVTSVEGWKDMMACMKSYTEGVAKGTLSMIDPRTYIALVQLVGIGVAKLYLGEDTWGQLKEKIEDEGDRWTSSNPTQKAEMLGTFMGAIVGTKGISVGVSSVKAAAGAEAGARIAAAKAAAMQGIGIGRGAASEVATTAKTVAEEVTEAGKRSAEEAGKVGRKAAKKAGKVGEESAYKAPEVVITLDLLKKQSAELLGVTEGATEAEIKSAFKRLSRQWHPDMPTGDQVVFQELQRARDILLNRGKPGIESAIDKAVLAKVRAGAGPGVTDAATGTAEAAQKVKGAGAEPLALALEADTNAAAIALSDGTLSEVAAEARVALPKPLGLMSDAREAAAALGSDAEKALLALPGPAQAEVAALVENLAKVLSLPGADAVLALEGAVAKLPTSFPWGRALAASVLLGLVAKKIDENAELTGEQKTELKEKIAKIDPKKGEAAPSKVRPVQTEIVNGGVINGVFNSKNFTHLTSDVNAHLSDLTKLSALLKDKAVTVATRSGSLLMRNEHGVITNNKVSKGTALTLTGKVLKFNLKQGADNVEMLYFESTDTAGNKGYLAGGYLQAGDALQAALTPPTSTVVAAG